MSEKKPRAALLGVGLDCDDGHKRLTKGEQFAVVGGSESTHEQVTETLVKTCEDLKRQGRSLEQAEGKEIADLIHKNFPGN